ncbi:hypothetical protein QQF64_031339 [Cirrhinus molitorella]|uniref:ribonuclease H n=1 Tax=Cirrhinus molitorella TaxID=172907 RepID=A0ABR3MWU8_9TELE
MLKLGVIEPSRSAWSSPIVMVPKPDGTLHFCNDFRRLNEVSEFDGYPMPRVDELLKRLGRARFISTLDLTKGYWQVAFTESAKPKTAFSTPSGHWQYRTLPFGLHGAPATFQRMMDVLLRTHQAYAAVYLDDVVIHSETWEEHLGQLRRVLMELRRAGLTANPRKCHLALAEAQYLGFQVGRGLIRLQQRKIEDILNAPLPKTKTQVQDGEEHPVIYISRKLTTAETQYAAMEKEALAIKWAVLELRYYLLGHRFTLMTDHAPLHWMSRAKDTNARIAAEFHRITNISLKNKFYAELDKHTPRLLAVYRQKPARTGKAAEALRSIFSAYDLLETNDINNRRTAGVRGLPVYLREDDSVFFKMWNTEEVDEPDIADSAVALVSMVNGDSSSTVQFDPAGIAIVLEGDIVLRDICRLADTFLLMFGLIYALHLDYSKELTQTFNFIQKVLLGLEDSKPLAPRLLSLKNYLLIKE